MLQKMTNNQTKMWRLFERTAAENDQKRLCLREKEQENTTFDGVFNPRVRLHRLDIHQTVLIKKFSAEEWRFDVGQQDLEPPNIKDEEEELWISVEEEQHNVKKEPDATMFSFTAFPLKSEDEEKPLLQLHQLQEENGDLPTSSTAEQMKVEANEDACGATETTCNADLNTHDQDSSSSETEVSEEDEDWISTNFQQQHLSDSGTKTKDCKGSRSESSVNAVKSFSCSECGKQVLSNCSLQRHMTCHSRVRSSGDLSDKECFGVKKNVASSSKVETALKCFSCDDCGERLTSKRKLNTHTRIHTGEKLFVCDVCGHTFNLKTNLERHMRIHTGQKPFGCDICGQRFSQKINLNRHATVHTGQKRFGCDVCERTFIEKGKLDVHMRIHTGEKPFGCDVCDQRFRDKGSLNTHMKIHTEQKPFACDVCGHRFRHKVNLNTHIRIHTGEKPFACGNCGKRFRHRLSLNTHIKNHTGLQKV